ncbi:MAG TPA: ATP-binding protein [Chthoniobacterales bacterium]|nr:ATP-binding protein [Chthoniobacterales bacterium]
MRAKAALLKRLAQVGFETSEGSVTPFGESLPLVTAWAIDDETASICLLAEDTNEVADEDPWRELLFAVSGLRHQLREGRPPAFGTPVLIALLENEEQERRLRCLIEDLSERYVLFSRVELSVVVGEGTPLEIDRALAPLLPHCRDAIRQEVVIGHQVLESLAVEIQESISLLPKAVDEPLRARADEVARAYGSHLAEVMRGPETGAFRPTPWSSVSLENFRSFAAAEIPLGTLTLAEGLNGTGKSTLIEALEILWAGTSQRKPGRRNVEGVRPASFARWAGPVAGLRASGRRRN